MELNFESWTMHLTNLYFMKIYLENPIDHWKISRSSM